MAPIHESAEDDRSQQIGRQDQHPDPPPQNVVVGQQNFPRALYLKILESEPSPKEPERLEALTGNANEANAREPHGDLFDTLMQEH